jgi:predicted RNA methylase
MLTRAILERCSQFWDGALFDVVRIAMGRFASTVAYYESARPPYGSAFFAAVARQLVFNGNQRLLDVGAGPGLLAIGFAPYCYEAVGVDPEPGMVEAARAAAAR